MGSFIPWLMLHFAIAASGTWWARHYALRQQLIDEPGDRRSHRIATPRGGGIAIAAALLLAAAWLAWQAPQERELFAAFAAGLLLVAGAGWWDDHRPASPWLRLVVHAVAGSVFALALYRVSGNVWQAGAAWLAVLVLVNVWNFMDGINGLAASQALIAAAVSGFALSGPWAWLAAALFAACCGFLPFNFPRARIFLGDVGSGALGFSLAALVSVAPDTAIVPLPLLVLPLSAFLIDAGFTLLARMLKKEPWWRPHVTHLYQRAARRFGHASVTFAFGLFSGVTVLLIWMLSNSGTSTALIAVGMWYLVGLALWGSLRKGMS